MTSLLTDEIFAAFIGALGVIVALYMYYRYNKSHLSELATREARPVLQDRAFNQIRLGQAAADRLAREGHDVSDVRSRLAQAEKSRLAGNYDMAIEQAKQAQDLLATARAASSPLPGSSSPTAAARPPTVPVAGAPPGSGPTPSPSGASRAAPPSMSGPSSSAMAADTELPVGSSSRPPKNKMEAHFQLSVAQDELTKARAAKPAPKALREASRVYDNAQAAYDRQDFTEALRLALKSRRTLGTRVEALPVAGGGSSGATAPGNPGGASQTAPSAAADPSFGSKCPQCGRPAASTDQFCRTCGATIPPALCTSCGGPLLAGDRFCGRCGAAQP